MIYSLLRTGDRLGYLSILQFLTKQATERSTRSDLLKDFGALNLSLPAYFLKRK